MRSGDNHKAVPHPDRRYARHLLHPGAEPEGRNGTGEGVFLLGSRVLFCSEENKWSRASCQGIHNPQHDFFPSRSSLLFDRTLYLPRGANKYQNHPRRTDRRNRSGCRRCSRQHRKAVHNPDPEEKLCQEIDIWLKCDFSG